MEEIDLKDLLHIFWTKKILIFIITFLAMIIGFCYTFFFVTPRYKAYTTLILVNNQENQDDSITRTDIQLNQDLISTYSDLLKSKKVIRQVINNLKINRTEEEIRNSISVSYKTNNEIIEIDVTDEEPRIARDVANEAANVFKVAIAESIFNMNNVRIIDEAEEDVVPYNIHHMRDIFISAIIGVVLGAGAVLVMNMFNPTINDAKEIERVLKIKVLAEIPNMEGDKE